MYEGQQVIQAVFRQSPHEGRPFKQRIGNLEFDKNGTYIFTGNPDTYEGVRNFLSVHDVRPDSDPLATMALQPAKLGGKKEGAAITPPSEDYSDLDDLSDIKALKGIPNVDASNGSAAASRNGTHGNGSEGAGSEGTNHIDLRSGSNGNASRSEGSGAATDPSVGSKDTLTPAVSSDDDYDFA